MRPALSLPSPGCTNGPSPMRFGPSLFLDLDSLGMDDGREKKSSRPRRNTSRGRGRSSSTNIHAAFGACDDDRRNAVCGRTGTPSPSTF